MLELMRERSSTDQLSSSAPCKNPESRFLFDRHTWVPRCANFRAQPHHVDEGLCSLASIRVSQRDLMPGSTSPSCRPPLEFHFHFLAGMKWNPDSGSPSRSRVRSMGVWAWGCAPALQLSPEHPRTSFQGYGNYRRTRRAPCFDEAILGKHEHNSDSKIYRGNPADVMFLKEILGNVPWICTPHSAPERRSDGRLPAAARGASKRRVWGISHCSRRVRSHFFSLRSEGDSGGEGEWRRGFRRWFWVWQASAFAKLELAGIKSPDM